MNTLYKRSLGAATALTAVLALGSTSASAQEAPPLNSTDSITAGATVPSTPAQPAAPIVSAPASTTSPRIVLPDVPVAPAAVVNPDPVPATADTNANTETATAATTRSAKPPAAANTRTAARSSARAEAPAPAAITGSTNSGNTPDVDTTPPESALPTNEVSSLTAPPVAPVVTPVDQVSEPALRADDDADGNLAMAGLVGLLGLVGLGGAGFMMMRRRRQPVYEEAEAIEMAPAEPVAPEATMEPAASVYVAPASVVEPPQYAQAEAEPRTAAPVAATMEDDALEGSRSPFLYNRYYKGKAAQDRPVFVMPDGPVPTGAARTALLDEMIAARPDADNPCTSPKGRLRRARSLLSQREHALREQALQPFDFREYEPTGANRPAATKPVPHMA